MSIPSNSSNPRGSALVVALIVMALLAAAIMSLMTNVEIDLFTGRNVRILKQAFQWSTAGWKRPRK
jgi:type II secretory pathway component PulK